MGPLKTLRTLQELVFWRTQLCAFFADIDKRRPPRPDCRASAGPLLFLNQGGGKIPPQAGCFPVCQSPPKAPSPVPPLRITTATDGWTSIFCLYAYIPRHGSIPLPHALLRAEKVRPIHDAQQSGRSFRDVTKAIRPRSKQHRFSFCCSWV